MASVEFLLYICMYIYVKLFFKLPSLVESMKNIKFLYCMCTLIRHSALFNTLAVRIIKLIQFYFLKSVISLNNFFSWSAIFHLIYFHSSTKVEVAGKRPSIYVCIKKNHLINVSTASDQMLLAHALCRAFAGLQLCLC